MRAVFLSLSMFCLNLVFGQNIEEIKLNVNIQDPMKSTKSEFIGFEREQRSGAD